MLIRKYQKQTVRIGGKLLADLQLLEKQTPFSFSEIARKAIRKYRRIRPDLSTITPDSTYSGSVIRFELEYKIAPEDLRKILAWYIGLHDLSKPFYTAPEIPTKKAIVVSEI